MGICGQFIDAGTPEQRDRIIEGMEWGDDFVNWENHSCKCLTGHAEAWTRDSSNDLHRADAPIDHRATNLHGIVAFHQFPKLCRRFGKDRVVRLCKMRAAKGNAVVIEVSTLIEEKV